MLSEAVLKDGEHLKVFSQSGLSGLIENHIGNISFNSKNTLCREGLFLSLLGEIKKYFLSSDSYFDISNINDVAFIDEMNKHMFVSFPDIFKKGSSNSYSEIYLFLFLLGNRLGKDFFEDGDIYSKENFENIFGSYLSKIKSFDDLNSNEFSSYLDSFARLCGVLNLICLLSQNNNLKRDFIFGLSSFMTQKIDELLSYLKSKGYNNKEGFNSILFIKGLQPLNFSYIEYVHFDDSKDGGLDDFLKEYDGIIGKTLDGFELCKKSDYGNKKEREGIIKKATLTNLSHIISLIILKTNGKVPDDELFNNPMFQRILSKFLSGLKSIGIEREFNIRSVSDIKKICNIIYIENYNFGGNNSFSNFESENFVNNFLDGITKGEKVTSVNNLEKIHHLVLLNTDLSEETLLGLLNFLYSEKSSSNINYEILRLKLFNIILTRLVTIATNINGIKNFLKKLTDYIDRNKISSFLLFAYSLMYVTISYCYSYFKDEESQRLSCEILAKYEQIDHGNYDVSRNGINIDRLYYNIGFEKVKNPTRSLKNYNHEQCRGDCSVDMDGCKHRDHIIITGDVLLREKSADYNDGEVRRVISNLDTYFSFGDIRYNFDLKLLSENLSRNLSGIFHGLSEIRIIEINEPNQPAIPRYHTLKEIEITNGYRLQFIYPNIFAKDFEDFYRRVSGLDKEAKIESNEDSKKLMFNDGSGMGLIVEKLKVFLSDFSRENALSKALVSDFEEAFKNGKVSLEYQGIFDENGNIVKYEVLSRIWGKLRKKFIYKGEEVEVGYNIREYIDAITKMKRPDLLKELLRFIIDDSRKLQSQFKSLSLSINFEYSDIIDNEMIDLLIELKNVGFDSSKITIELIEGKWENNKASIDNIRRLREQGFKIAMDDFGAGDSSINRLLDLLKEGLLDLVKIDGEIIRKIGNGENGLITNRLIIERDTFNELKKEAGNIDIDSIIARLSESIGTGENFSVSDENEKKSLFDLFKTLKKFSESSDFGLVYEVSEDKIAIDITLIISMIVGVCSNHRVDVVAERVENMEIFHVLKKLGVKYFQGYGLGKPITKEQLLSELKAV